MKAIQQKLDRLDDAFIYKESIDLGTYERPYGSFSNLIASTPARSGAWFCPTAKRRRTV